MMYESLRPNGTSKWAAYFDLLPAPGSFDSLMFWSEAELEDLKGSLVLSKIGLEEAEHEYRETLLPFVSQHEDVLGPKEGYTMERFHWCGSLILSRSFHVDVKDDGKDQDEGEDSDDEEDEERESVDDVAMVPMADLLNAKSGCDNVGAGGSKKEVARKLILALPRAGPIVLRASDSEHDVYGGNSKRSANLQHIRGPAQLGPPPSLRSCRRSESGRSRRDRTRDCR